ncbi:MAG: OmpA family protein [Acidobacteria bacterium]|nr:OmpA family protein [Acidobacteriota bacterium]
MVRKTLFFVALLSLLTASLFAQGLTTDAKKGDWEEINFAFDRAVLTDGYPSLLRLAELLKQHPDYKVKLEGHADHKGSDDYNVRLARQRAEMVRDFLVKYGASASQISAETYGENRPTSDNNLQEGRWMNRRVEVTVTDG